MTFFPKTLEVILGKMEENRKATTAQAIRGNAYLIAGLIRALGIGALKETELLRSLETGVGEKKES